MNLNRVSTFVRVVETGTFTAAATALGLPKSSVSRAVAQLEDALGVLLLQRTTRKLSLTDAGRAYFQKVRGALGDLEQAHTTVAEMGHELRGIVRVTAPGDFGNGIFSEVIGDFLRLHPGIHVDVTLTGRWVNLVEEGFDLAVRAGQLRDSSLVARKIATTELGVYAAPAYLERRGHPKRLADLAKHDCLLFRSSKGVVSWRLTGPRGPESIAVSGPVTADGFDFIHSLTVKGVGIGLLPELGCEGDLARGALVRLLPGYALRGGAIHVVSPPLRYVPARVALLRQHLITELTRRLR